MINAKYRVFYEYNGPTMCDPFREELAEEDICENLGRFPDELSTILWLDNEEPTVMVEEENLGQHWIVVSVRSRADDNRYDQCIKTALNGLDLFAKTLERSRE